MKTEQLLELIREHFDVSEYDEDDRCIVLHSRRNGVLRFERFAQRVLEAAPAVEGEPTAWLIESGSSDGDEDIVTLNHGVVRRFKRAGHNSTPLYTHRQPSLAEKIERIRALKVEGEFHIDSRVNNVIDLAIAILEENK